MQRCAFTPYEGKKPYIFISYAHKDSEQVFPILEELDRRGYRIWYDDGIAPGSEWPENIAQHLDGCSLTLAFISPNSIASANCRREVTFALAKHKPFLGIVLKPTEMSLGMEMQLSAQQCIMKYTYATQEDFYRKICSCPDLEPCLGQPKAVPVPAAAPAVASEPKQEARTARQTEEKKAKPAKSATKLPVKPAVLIAATAALVVVALVLVIFLGGDADPNLGGGPGGTTGSSATGNSEPIGSTDERSLVYQDQVITAKDAAYISQQTKLETLEMRNCTVQEGAFDALKMAQTVTRIEMENCTGVHNLHSLGDMKELASLKLVNCDIHQEDMPKLDSQVLEYVDISGNPQFNDLSVFEACTGIRHIHFAHSGVDSLEALADMEHLVTVDGDNSCVTDLSPICALTELKEIRLAGCGLTSTASLIYSLHLETVDLSHNKLTNLDFMQYCAALSYVDVSYNLLEEVDLLGKSAATLTSLNLGGNAEVYFFDLDFLNSCTKLEWLSLDGIYLTNLEVISELVNLKHLSAVNCTILDLEDIRKLTQLEYLNLAFNRISDLEPLKNLSSYYQVLDLSFNDSLSDVSALNTGVNFRVLNLVNTYVDPYTIPPVWGDTLVVAYWDAWMDNNCMDESDRSIFAHIQLVDCPMDKIVAMENRFGVDRVGFLQNELDYMECLEALGIDCSYLRATMK